MNNAGRFALGAGLGCMLLIGAAFASCVGIILVSPTNEVLAGKELSPSLVAELRRLQLLGADELPIYFCADGLFDATDRGAFFSATRVVSFDNADAGDTLEQARYEEIADLEVVFGESFGDNTEITVKRKDITEFVLSVSTTEGGDRRFYNRLVKEWRNHGGLAPAEPTRVNVELPSE